jgi:signal peptidase I
LARERHAQKERQKKRLEWRNAFFAAVFIVAAARFLFWPLRIDKTSMGNNFKNGQIVFTSALMTGIKRGTVVVLKDGVWENSGKELCRIIGLPGERVTIYNGDVFINGIMINESYSDGETLAAEDTDKTVTFSLSDEQYFLLYDDRQIFSDSRSKGELTKDQFSSVVLFSRK